MRCPDIQNELIAPEGRLDPAERARHLADCPTCAAFARQSVRLDRAWAATRPEEPSADAFDRLWADVSRRAAEPEPRVLTFPAPLLAVAGLVAAAAAALLAVAAFGPGTAPENGPIVAQQPPAPPVLEVNVDSDRLVVIRLDDANHAVIDRQPLKPISDTMTVAADFDILIRATAVGEDFGGGAL